MIKAAWVLGAASCLLLHAANVVATEVAAPDVQVGDLWRYRNLDGFTNEVQSEVTQRVIDKSDSEIVVRLHNEKTDKTALVYFNRQWNELDGGQGKYDPYYPEYRFPLSAGLKWHETYTWLSSTGAAASGEVDAQVMPLEKIDVAAGSFDAYRIERDIQSRNNDATAMVQISHVTTWYAPAVRRFVRRTMVVSRDGRVRSKSAIELVSYTLVKP